MKRSAVILALLALSLPVLASGDLRLSLGAGYLSVEDHAFQSIYGKHAVMPELVLSRTLVRELRLRLGVAMFSRNGTVPPFDDAVSARQILIGLAPEWEHPFTRRISLTLHAGGLLALYRESAFNEISNHRAFGFDAGAGICISLGGRLLGCLSAGYSRARDTLYPGTEEEAGVTLGGFRAGFGLGLRL
jgi:hypothetical protein